jgi:hypothetical protein
MEPYQIDFSSKSEREHPSERASEREREREREKREENEYSGGPPLLVRPDLHFGRLLV